MAQADGKKRGCFFKFWWFSEKQFGKIIELADFFFAAA